MDNGQRPIGGFESVTICWGVAALVGLAFFGVMFVPFGWTALQAAFGGGVVFLLIGAVLTLSFSRELPAPGHAPDPSAQLDLPDGPDAAQRALAPRDLSVPSPHRDGIGWSDISETSGPDLNTPSVNKAFAEEQAPFKAGDGLAQVSASTRPMSSAPTASAASPTPASADQPATMKAREIQAASPHKDAVEPSAISDTSGPDLNDPRVNKSSAGTTATTATSSAPPAASAPTPTASPAKPAAATAASPSTPASAASEPTTASASDDPGPGTKPAGLATARDGKADDLKKIKGVGPKLETLCNSLGFYHFDQIAAWTPDEVAWVDQNLVGFKGRVTRDDWVSQAKLLAEGGETAFSKKVDKGGVY